FDGFGEARLGAALGVAQHSGGGAIATECRKPVADHPPRVAAVDPLLQAVATAIKPVGDDPAAFRRAMQAELDKAAVERLQLEEDIGHRDLGPRVLPADLE